MFYFLSAVSRDLDLDQESAAALRSGQLTSQDPPVCCMSLTPAHHVYVFSWLKPTFNRRYTKSSAFFFSVMN